MNLHSGFVIDGHRVRFFPGSGWDCECGDFGRARKCLHVREAAAVRALRKWVLKRALAPAQSP